LEPLNEQEQVTRWTKEIFETWLGTRDITSAVRERLYFSAKPNAAAPRVVLNSYVGSVSEYAGVAEAAEALDRQAHTLSRAAPAARVGGALLKEAEGSRRELARRLVDTTTAPLQVLVVTPDAAAVDGAEARCLVDFSGNIPQPPAHGARLDQSGDDHAAVRRVELGEMISGDGMAPEALPFAAPAEQEAELLRRRAERKYDIVVPIFPPELRVALAQRDGFRSFARAYKAGSIVRREDAAGVSQWVFADTGEFLTFGPEPTLAQAAANYVCYVGSPPESFARESAGGSFAKVEEWKRRREAPDDDVLSLIAIDVYED
jgi:hypothetical protein